MKISEQIQWNRFNHWGLRLALFCVAMMTLSFHPGAETENKQKADHAFPGNEQPELWVLAGQSNAGGYGLLKAPVKPNPRIMYLNQKNEWQIADEPEFKGFSRHNDEIAKAVWDNVMLQRGGLPMPPGMTVEGFLGNAEKADKKMVGVESGYFFAKNLIKEVNRPVGIISLGCRTVKQWDPTSTETLYPGFRSKMAKAGGKIRGFIYYQGETDAATHPDAPKFGKYLLMMIDNVRREAHEPDLPFIIVQLGHCARRDDGKLNTDWELVREAQRTVAKQRDHVYVTTTLDLPTDDAVHISEEGHLRLGWRLAEIALSEVYHRPGHGHAIDYTSMQVLNPGGERPIIRVRFSGVTGHLHAEGRAHGFELRPASSQDDGYHTVYRVDMDPTDPSAVLVGIFHPFGSEPYDLIYGPGMDPYVNIADDKDMPIPAFGPLRVEVPAASSN